MESDIGRQARLKYIDQDVLTCLLRLIAITIWEQDLKWLEQQMWAQDVKQKLT